jgi:two-component system cell cycle response regulator
MYDLILQRAAKVLAKSFRGDDVIARIGGDEFAVILPNTGPEAIEIIFARIRNNVQDANKGEKEIILSLSLGSATAEKGKELESTLKKADQIMYKDKQAKSRK